ncbi:uncharacterized protein LOC125212521 [Salvia hispanica]|uniref:uncharacterized protein LOC125212521 n=1 Tax=Salvia hispanica TaxID=49212 RepID=UPI002009A1A5|nr:uncharacterized protein LOC125212521 [Salvia hispanica]
MAVAIPSPAAAEKKHWWLTNRKMVERYVREARMLIATKEQSEIAAALRLLDAALAVAPRMEVALEMKARSLLYLRRFKEVVEMLQDYIPSLKMAISDDASTTGSSDSASAHLSREGASLLSSGGGSEPACTCFSVSDLKKKVISGLFKNVEESGQWRYSVLGQACCHLGLMEDALVLLQTGKRLATAAFRRRSNSLTDDIFSSINHPFSGNNHEPKRHPKTEFESISRLLCHTKLLIRRKTAAVAALDAGLHAEAVRHFMKILDGRRGAPQGFLAECYVHRASAFRSAGRIAEAIGDCNRALALDTSCIDALAIRATLFESIRCFHDSLHDLEHLKLLYNSIQRDRKTPGPVWKRQKVQYREIPGKLCSVAAKIQQLKQRLASGETGDIDYHALIGLRRGCSRSELERAHLLLMLRHKPDQSWNFMHKCEFADEKDVDSVRDGAKMSALVLHRMIQRGYASLMAVILEDEAVEKQRNNAAEGNTSFQGVFCRDVGNSLSHTRFNHPIPVKYEALTC